MVVDLCSDDEPELCEVESHDAAAASLGAHAARTAPGPPRAPSPGAEALQALQEPLQALQERRKRKRALFAAQEAIGRASACIKRDWLLPIAQQDEGVKEDTDPCVQVAQACEGCVQHAQKEAPHPTASPDQSSTALSPTRPASASATATATGAHPGATHESQQQRTDASPSSRAPSRAPSPPVLSESNHKPSAASSARAQKAAERAAEKARKQAEREATKAQKAAAKAAKEAEKQQLRAAKAAESRARGSKAHLEVTVVVDTQLVQQKRGRSVLDALDSHDVKYAYSVEPGKLEGFCTVTWRHTHPNFEGEEETEQVPYVLISLSPADATPLLQSDTAMDDLLRSVTRVFGPVTLCLQCVGLERALKTDEQRAHAAAVRAGQPGHDENRRAVCMERLLQLHLKHQGVTYRDCWDEAAAADHVVALTAAISTQRYKGGPDILAAFAQESKTADTLKRAIDVAALSSEQARCAKVVYNVPGLGPKPAAAIAARFKTIGALISFCCSHSAEDLFVELGKLQHEGRGAGKVLAHRIHHILTCEDGQAGVGGL